MYLLHKAHTVRGLGSSAACASVRKWLLKSPIWGGGKLAKKSRGWRALLLAHRSGGRRLLRHERGLLSSRFARTVSWGLYQKPRRELSRAELRNRVTRPDMLRNDTYNHLWVSNASRLFETATIRTSRHQRCASTNTKSAKHVGNDEHGRQCLQCCGGGGGG